jgi:hypothetical protein
MGRQTPEENAPCLWHNDCPAGQVEISTRACLEKDPNRRPQDAGQLFRMAHQCSCEGWNGDTTRRWRETHLLELTGPLTLIEDVPASGAIPAAIH